MKFNVSHRWKKIERERERINKHIERCKERRAIAAAYIRISGRQRVKTGVREINILFVHQKVMYSLKYNYFLFHIYESKLLSCSYFEV